MDDHDNLPQVNELPAGLEEFDFDQWRDLHDSDPAHFEACRRKVLNDFIEGSNPQNQARLRGLVFAMEGQYRIAKSPYDYNLRLGSMMMKMLGELHTELQYFGGQSSVPREPVNPGRVIPFRKLT